MPRSECVLYYNDLLHFNLQSKSTHIKAMPPAQVPNLVPVDPFTDDAHENFHTYLQETPHRLRFNDERYNQYKTWLIEARQGLLSADEHPAYSQGSSSSRPTMDLPLLSRNEQKARHRVVQKFYLNEDDRVCCRDSATGNELRVLRDWQLYGVITNTHCGIPHGGQEKTFNIITEEYYGIIRPEVRWLLKHCKVSGTFLLPALCLS